MKRSTVNAVIVRTDAAAVASVMNVLNKQYTAPNLHGYASHTVYSSGGRPVHGKMSIIISNFPYDLNVFICYF